MVKLQNTYNAESLKRYWIYVHGYPVPEERSDQWYQSFLSWTLWRLFCKLRGETLSKRLGPRGHDQAGTDAEFCVSTGLVARLSLEKRWCLGKTQDPRRPHREGRHAAPVVCAFVRTGGLGTDKEKGVGLPPS